MQVVIGVKCRGGKVRLETRKREDSKDNVREQNLGNQLLAVVNTIVQEIMQRGGGSWSEETHNNA